MADQSVNLVDYDPKWADLFEQERTAVTDVLRPWLAGDIEHVGSTAIPEMRAKPVIDMLAPVRSLDEAREAVPALTEAGWQYWAEDPEGDIRLWFLRPEPENRTHHLHVIAADHPRAHALVAFRDTLRTSKVLRTDYMALKGWLAQRHQHNRNAYTNAKSAFVDRVLREAGMEPPTRARLPE